MYRAKFSALTVPELVQAYDNLARSDYDICFLLYCTFLLHISTLVLSVFPQKCKYDTYYHRPDKYAAMCVDARQELDLKIGVAFSRLMTKAYLDMAREKFRLKDQKVLDSYFW